MADLTSYLAIALTALLIPWIIYHIPYFKRPDVQARRAAKASLPAWVSNVELLILAASEATLIYLFYSTEARIHHIIHPELPFLPSIQASLSLNLILWLIQVCAPLTAALPLGMILANFMAWSILPIQEAENSIMDEGVPGYTWRDLNMGLLRAAAVMVPISLILASISLMKL